MKKIIAAHCRMAGRPDIYASYIHHITCVDRRRDVNWFSYENDFSFTHRGSRYIIREHIVGDKRYSALKTYTVEEVTEA